MSTSSQITGGIVTKLRRKEMALRKVEMKLMKDGGCSSLHVLLIIQTPARPPAAAKHQRKIPLQEDIQVKEASSNDSSISLWLFVLAFSCYLKLNLFNFQDNIEDTDQNLVKAPKTGFQNERLKTKFFSKKEYLKTNCLRLKKQTTNKKNLVILMNSTLK